jgi:hypothetical protein
MKTLFPALLLILVTASAATAQEESTELYLEAPAARQGYYIAGGLDGALNQNTRKELGETGLLLGQSSHARIGQMVTSWLGFGLHMGGGATSNETFDASFGGLALEMQLVPFEHVSLGAAVGAGGLGLTDKTDEEGELDGTGGGYFIFRAGYDIFPLYDGGSGGLSFTPNVQLMILPGEVFEATIFTVGVEVVWWSGLDTNKLIMPDTEGYTLGD